MKNLAMPNLLLMFLAQSFFKSHVIMEQKLNLLKKCLRSILFLYE